MDQRVVSFIFYLKKINKIKKTSTGLEGLVNRIVQSSERHTQDGAGLESSLIGRWFDCLTMASDHPTNRTHATSTFDNHFFLSICLSTQQTSDEATQPSPNLPASCCSILAQSFWRLRLTPFLPAGSGGSRVHSRSRFLSHGDRATSIFLFLGQLLAVSFERAKIRFTIASRDFRTKVKFYAAQQLLQ